MTRRRRDVSICPTCRCFPRATLRVSEVAKAWRVPERTVRNFCETGEIPATKFGSTWRIDHEAFDEYCLTHNNRFDPLEEKVPQ